MILEQFLGDIRVSIRSLRRSPGFATVVIATLSIGIAAVTALFSAVYSYQYRPLPYEDSDRIVAIVESSAARFASRNEISNSAAAAVLSAVHSFERTALFRTRSARYLFGERSTYLSTLWIDSSFAPLFHLHPQLGRNLTATEIESGAPSVLISDVLWRTSFGADPKVLGKTFRAGDTLLTIVGVLPEGFRYPLRTDVWRPIRPSDSLYAPLTLLGKLRREVSRDQLTQQLSVVAQRLARSDSVQFARESLSPGEMIDRNSGPAVLRIAFLFVGAAVFVLLIACGNVVNLFLVRAAERRGEMAVRASLGASRARLVMHGLVEAVLLSGSAAVIGTSLSAFAVKLLIPMMVPRAGMPSWVHFSVDARILAFTVIMSAVASLAVGVAPALDGARPDLMRMLKAGGDRMLSRGGVGKRARLGIVVQLTFSVVLLVSALLFARSYQRISTVDVGYPASEILLVMPDFGDPRYANDTTKRAFMKALLRRVEALPGVKAAAIRGRLGSYVFAERPKPGEKRDDNTAPDARLYVDGERATNRSPSSRSLDFRNFSVSDGYFRTLGVRIVAGRGIASTDVEDGEKVAVVNRKFASLFWPGGNALGHSLSYGTKGVPVRVVGVVEDVRDVQSGRSGIAAVARPDVYFSNDQVLGQAALLARGDGDGRALQVPLERAVRGVDPMMDPYFAPMSEGIESVQLTCKVFGGLLFAFSISGLVLSLIGIYGIVAYGITERTREIGIRLALGGTSRDVVHMIVRSSLQFIAIGLGIGLGMSQGTNRLLGKLIYDVSPADPPTYVIVVVVFGAVGLMSAYLPARRASKVDPVIALRAD